MDFNVKYNPQSVLVDSLYITDIGNCALEAVDDKGLYYYLVIITKAGSTHILTWGPIVPDIILVPKGYSESYGNESYKEDKLQKYIAKWVLGGKGYTFTEINQIKPEEALTQYRNLGAYMKSVMEG